MAHPDHRRLEELIAADALDGLDRADREDLARLLAEHGPECPECLRLRTAYAEVAGDLALALDPAPPSAGAEERLLRAARDLASPEAVVRVPDLDRRPPRTGPVRRWIAAAAAAALLAVAAGAAGYLLAPEPPGIRVVTLSGEPGTLAVAFQPGRGEAWVIGADLPAPEGDRVYELWFRRAGSTRMEPAGTFVPRDGRVLTRTVLAGAVDLLAVTVEPPGGSLQPTSEPVFVGPVPGS